MGLIPFEQLGEEYPDTIAGSIIAAEGAIANVVDMAQINPSFKDLRKLISYLAITPRTWLAAGFFARFFFYYRSSDLFFLSADRGTEFVPAREWMRICSEPPELLEGTALSTPLGISQSPWVLKMSSPSSPSSSPIYGCKNVKAASVAPSPSPSSRRLVVPSRVSLLFSMNTEQRSLTSAPVV
jgi:hypothetical protein